MLSSNVYLHLHSHSLDWVTWKTNPPYASHMGGAWECQIPSVHAILSSLMETPGRLLDEESLATLTADTKRIFSSRLLTTDNVSDPSSNLPLSPSNLLTMKSKIILLPPGDFSKPDLYSFKRWRRVQHKVN